jgi:threonine dehydrogenase-like Zn-dependent dehydrogenase
MLGQSGHLLGGHRLRLEDGSAAYQAFRDKQDGCIKVDLKPWA